jgi:excisionase family DNA binding protein
MPKPKQPSDDFLTFETWLGFGSRAIPRLEAASILGISDSQIDRLIERGELAAFDVGQHSVRIFSRDLARYLFERRKPATRPPPESEPQEQAPAPRRRGRPRTNPVRHIQDSEK